MTQQRDATELSSGGQLPSGTVTFLFTDIEGSTRLLQDVGNAYAELLAAHRRLIVEAAEAEQGRPFGSEGDALFIAFGRPASALSAAAEAQHALAAHPWPGGRLVRVRMGIHTGEVTLVGADYVGLPL